MIDSVMKHRRDNTPPVVGAIVLVTYAAIDKAISCLKRIFVAFLSFSRTSLSLSLVRSNVGGNSIEKRYSFAFLDGYDGIRW